MNWENLLNNVLYGIVVLGVIWGLGRVWKNMRDRRGLSGQIAGLVTWATTQNWKLVDTKAKVPWRKQYEEASGTAYLIPKAVALGAIDEQRPGMVAVGQVYDDINDEGQPGIIGNIVF